MLMRLLRGLQAVFNEPLDVFEPYSEETTDTASASMEMKLFIKRTSFLRYYSTHHKMPCQQKYGESGVTMKEAVTFAQRMKILRKQVNLTQVNMAQLLGCTERHYQKIEYGKVNIPMSDLITLADCFNVSIDYLVGRTDNP